MDLMDRIKEVSGNIKSNDPLVHFLYILMRDHLSCGKVEDIMFDVNEFSKNKDTDFGNGWLAQYCMDIAKRLKEFEEPK